MIQKGKCMKNFLKDAFTLSEVLITLGVIGVIAAMTIPGLVNQYNKKIIEAKLKEDYSLFQQVIRTNLGYETEIDMTVVDGSPAMLKSFWETYFAPYMKYAQLCVEEEGCWQSTGSVTALSGSVASSDRKGYGIGGSIITIRLYNGTNICMDAWAKADMASNFGIDTTDNAGISIYIDANGDSPPNRIGKDIYVLTYTQEFGIVPAGYSKTDDVREKDCSTTSSGSLSGYYCFYKVKNNGWVIPKEIWNRK
jgi:prepilin-type N-terminal cleavage/methylation domain-containing protein